MNLTENVGGDNLPNIVNEIETLICKEKLYLKRYIVQDLIKEFKIIPLFCVSLPGWTWHCGMNYAGIDF